MRKRAAIVLALILVSPASQAQRAAVAPWMTGEQLVKLLGEVDPFNVTWSTGSRFTKAELAELRTLDNRQHFQAYVEAVHDASEGREWCYSEKYRPAPLELVMDARHGLQRMTDDQLKRNAADLIIEIWHQRWPCRADRRKK